MEECEKVNPDCEVELRVLSSEVIVQHLHYGQPIDVAILLDSALLGRKGLQGRVLEELGLARVSLVRVPRGGLNGGIPEAGGLVLEASSKGCTKEPETVPWCIHSCQRKNCSLRMRR